MRGDGLTALHTLPLHPAVLEPHFDLAKETKGRGHYTHHHSGCSSQSGAQLQGPHCLPLLTPPKAPGTEMQGRTHLSALRSVLCLQILKNALDRHENRFYESFFIGLIPFHTPRTKDDQLHLQAHL